MFYDISTDDFYLNNKKFDLRKKHWVETNKIPNSLIKLSAYDAIKNLQKTSYRLRIPIGVIGTGSPDEAQYQVALEMGRVLAKLGLMVVCGGRAGIMEAVCKGVSEGNGISIGILPESTIEKANQYVSIPLSSGIGFARNAVIVSSSFCLIAIGGGNGTMSEIAYGLQFGKKVFTIKCDLPIANIIRCNDIEQIITNIYQEIFKIEKIHEPAQAN